MKGEIAASVKLLDAYIQNQQYAGIDPYDALNSTKLNTIRVKSIRVFFTQFFVYSPINFRPLFGIEKGINPKALGLLLSAYSNLYQAGLIDEKAFNEIQITIVRLLLENTSEDFSGHCWGFNFNWNDVKRNAKKFTPTLVVSSFVGNGFLDLYAITHEKKYLEIAESITKFILDDLHIHTFDTGICFSYSPIDTHVVHNANFLGAAFLSRVYQLNHDETLLKHAQQAFEYSFSQQKENGAWDFQVDPDTGTIRNQIDFHQGFIINAFCDFVQHNQLKEEKYWNRLSKAAVFYKRCQFLEDGRALWRLPFRYPIDIHHQAQGIITFCKLYSLFKNTEYLDFSKRIAAWTLKNMQDAEGFFYYQKWPVCTNRISYMRWGQAWMMLAVAKLYSELCKGG